MIRRLVDKTSPVACIFILIGFAIAGLSPFHAPQNGARWLGTESGIGIVGDGVVLSDRLFSSLESQQGECSVELWIHAANNRGASTILDFYQAHPQGQFSIRQVGNSLIQVIKASPSAVHVLEAAHTFFPGKRTLLTVTSGTKGTTLYLDAEPVLNSGDLELLNQDCSGQLSLGAAAISYSGWNGDLYGLAIFNSRLTESQVLQHYRGWNSAGHIEAIPSDDLIALYKFDERSGNIVHNEIAGEPDLLIPQRFQTPGRPFLARPWHEFQSGSIGWKDVLINIAGFIPFGFFIYSFLSSTKLKGRMGFAAIGIGMVVSLTIEVLQWYLPTRDSSMTDVLTNTAGTTMGAAMYRLIFGKLEARNS
jgi:hypothetical protein